MRWLRKLPGYGNSQYGLEWQLLRRMPAILFGGTAVLLIVIAAFHFGQLGSLERKQTLILEFTVIGVLVVHWTAVFTVSVGCVAVMIMKGPGYVADGYPLPTPPDTEDSTSPRNKGKEQADP